MFSENNLGKDYSSISKQELQFHVCNNERDLDESLRSMVEYFIHNHNNNVHIMMLQSFVNISKIKKFEDLCNEDLCNEDLCIADRYFIDQLISFLQILSFIKDAFSDDLIEILNFRKYCLPIFIILSLLGNCLSALVLFCKKMRSFSSNIYLGTLAISDMVFSMILFGEWLVLMEILNINCLHRFSYFLHWFNYFLYFLEYFSEFLSVWLIMAFTIERYIVIKYPLLRRSWCTASRARVVVITLIGLATLYSIFLIVLTDENHRIRNQLYTKEDINTYNVYKYATSESHATANGIQIFTNTIIIFTLPAVVIVICNTLIGCHIFQQNRIRKILITASGFSNETTQMSNNKMLQHRITKMLVLVSSIFVILKLPLHIQSYFAIYIYRYANMFVVIEIFDLLDIAHYSINFILYCVTGQNFRKELIRMFMKRTNIKRNINIMQNEK